MNSATPPLTTFRPGAHITALDALRGIAILTVLFGHLIWNEPRFYGGIGDLVYSVAGSSWCGVDLFFVLSGFLITGILYDAKGSGNFFRSFYARRVLRIFPLYYGVLIAALMWAKMVAPADPKVVELVANQGWLWFFSSNLAMGLEQRWLFGTPYVGLGHFWSLAVEEHFYFVWPLAVYFLNRRWLMTACIATTVAAVGFRFWLYAAGTPDVLMYVLTWCRMDSLATGALLALAVRGPHGLAGLLTPARWVFAVTGLGLALMVAVRGGQLDYHHPAVITFGFSVLSWFFGALLILAVAASSNTLAGRFWSLGLLRFFGKYSYALYVFQAIPRGFYHRLFPMETLVEFFGSYRAGLAVFALLKLGTMVMLAMFSWHLCEKHFLKLRKYFPYTSREGRPPSVAPVSRPLPNPVCS